MEFSTKIKMQICQFTVNKNLKLFNEKVKTSFNTICDTF